MVTCQSPVKVMRAAYELAGHLFDEHAHKFSRQDFTLPQLFACLVLREHQRKSYRGVEALLADCSDLRAAVGLDKAPDHNTIWRAFEHLVKPSGMNRALDVQAAQAAMAGLDVAGDSETAYSTSAGEDPDAALDLNRLPEGLSPPPEPVDPAAPPPPKKIPPKEVKEPAPPETPAGASGPAIQLGAYGSTIKADTAWRMLAGRFPEVAALNKVVVSATVAGKPAVTIAITST